jgi:hypothetical protein
MQYIHIDYILVFYFIAVVCLYSLIVDWKKGIGGIVSNALHICIL